MRSTVHSHPATFAAYTAYCPVCGGEVEMYYSVDGSDVKAWPCGHSGNVTFRNPASPTDDAAT